MQSNLGRVLAAGTALVLFVGAFIAFVANQDRIAGAATLAGLVALSLAVLAHLSDSPQR